MVIQSSGKCLPLSEALWLDQRASYLHLAELLLELRTPLHSSFLLLGGCTDTFLGGLELRLSFLQLPLSRLNILRMLKPHRACLHAKGTLQCSLAP